MDLKEHHLILVMEECFEVGGELCALGQRASKQLRFGGNEIQPGQLAPNAARLRYELLDLFACVRFLESAGMIEAITPDAVSDHMVLKSEKITRMLELSRAQGRLTRDAVQPAAAPAMPAGTTYLAGRLGHTSWCNHMEIVPRPCNCGASYPPGEVREASQTTEGQAK